MATFVASSTTLTVNELWSTVAPRRLVCKDINIVLAAQGGLTNNVPATALGLITIEEVQDARDASSNLYIATPSYDRKNIVFYDVTNVTDASRNAPADITATLRLTVKGKE